jgi:DNA-binding transcriptional LysR family regulator
MVFIAVVENGNYEAAASRLAHHRGSYTRQAVKGVIDKVEKWAGERLLAKGEDRRCYPTGRGQRVLEAMRRVVAEYEMMRGSSSPHFGLTLACHPHHTHFVVLAEDLLRDADAPGDQLRVEYLPQHQRGEGEFQQQAVDRLIRGEYQLIIGPPVEMEDVVSHPLYRAQLEVMIDKDFPHDAISLADLVAKYRMFVPPTDMRSRRLLEDSIVESGVHDPGRSVRIAGETYETATSVMRLRNDHRGGEKNRVVVMPSDVALAYKAGMEFGGRNADRFKWVPIYHRDAYGRGSVLRMQACVTVRRVESEKLAYVVEALRSGVAQLNESSTHGGLSGTAFPRR